MPETERKADARIAVSSETRRLVRDQKRGGETYDQVLRKMVSQYDPEAINGKERPR
jgi:cytochrome c-type biogenesis protein CcmH/NrfF